MKKGFTFRSEASEGFTLIELLVVISIIGVLASLAIVSYTSSQKQVRDTQRKSDLKQYQTALEAYANKNGSFYPSRPQASDTSTTLCFDLALTNCQKDPKDPTYTYSYISDGTGGGMGVATKFVLWATLENTTGFWIVCSNGKNAVNVAAPTTSSCPI